MWSLLVVLGLLALRHGWGRLRTLLADRRRMGYLSVAAAVISVNWGVFIWATTHDHVVDTSLGYFINPLVLIGLGVVVLGERLRPAQWAGLAIAVVAVVVLSVDYGRPPWVALALACSFGTYGLMKNRAAVGAVEGLTVETLLLTPVALTYVVWLQASGDGTLTEGPGHALLLAGTGVVTALPLLLFGAAATRVPLSTLGLLQYVAPVMQFLHGRAGLRRADVHRPLDRLRAGVGGAGDHHDRVARARPAGGTGDPARPAGRGRLLTRQPRSCRLLP